ncbi:MAG: hypothetical protein JST92_13525, partial [Deltaproteobacteria bacterium]|nr:hypothetical protein [Deltaproteobacteria bacterium]
MPMPNPTRRWFMRPLALGALFTLAQLVVAMACAQQATLAGTWLRLNAWDSGHYLSIAQEGYHLSARPIRPADVHELRSNVSHFPGLPLATRAVMLTGLAADPSQLVVAQGLALVFWVLFFGLLSRWGVPLQAQVLGGLAVFAHPAAYVLVAGYSESMYLAGLLGMLWFGERGETNGGRGAGPLAGRDALLAGLSGLWMSASRVVGLPLAIVPVLQRWGREAPGRRSTLRAWGWTWVTAGLTSLGTLGFFAYCQVKFGRWDLYRQLQELAWNNRPDWLVFFRLQSWLPHLGHEDLTTSVGKPSRALLFGFFFALVLRELRYTPTGLKRRSGMYLAALLPFILAIGGTARSFIDSSVRYSMPSFAILMLCLLQSQA